MTLAVRDSGRGPPVMLLHGFMGSAAAWGAAVLDALAADFRVLAVDLPGHGASERPREVARYSMDRVVADVLAVQDAAGEPSAAWIGYSMGGRVALAAAVTHPDRVACLVLESASPGLATPAARAERRAEDERRAERLERDGLEAFLSWWEDRPLFASRKGHPAATDLRALQLTNDPAALAACLRGLGTGSQPSYWDRLPTLRTPALLLTGDDDRKFTTLNERMAARMSRARHAIVPGAGHTVHLEDPSAWITAVHQTLQK